MKQCLGCRGLVPEGLEACPNCALSGLKKLVVAAGVIALTATGCLPVYGVPCTSRQVDGGNHGCIGECTTLLEDGGVPARDPSHSCYNPDGGVP